MEIFNKKTEKDNAWADRSLDKIFVDENASIIQCIAEGTEVIRRVTATL